MVAVFTRSALERVLYRLSISVYRDQFLLKGSLLFDLLFDMPHRPEDDADLLGFTPAEVPHLVSAARESSAIACAAHALPACRSAMRRHRGKSGGHRAIRPALLAAMKSSLRLGR
ncbi:nucleotidyl transferase AbiEii/AbiGii toxin family protein [Bordetella flabilis]|uniref:nucleotidyl transferase AbiEii/AbiGii toxin family protein n=1 Tax=Bordetella flabilis TaxID=463014 RepID=UPI0030019943